MVVCPAGNQAGGRVGGWSLTGGYETSRHSTIYLEPTRIIPHPQAVRQLLQQCYGRPEAVSEELVESVLAPARQPGAPAVFLECICNSRGPLPEEQLQVGTWGVGPPRLCRMCLC